MTARAGWFPDPGGRPQHYRWWDGSAWTRFLTTDPTAPAPDPDAVQRSAGDQDTDVQPAPDRAVDPAPSPAAGATDAPEISVERGPWPPGYERPPRPDGARQLSLKSALLGTGAVVLVAVIVLAIALFDNPAPRGLEPPPPDDSGALPPTPSPTPTAGGNVPDVTFDPVTRMFRMDGLALTLPAEPYAITRPDRTDLGGPGGGVRADAIVEKNYDGQGGNWAATVEVDQVGSEMRGKTLDQTADKIISTWSAAAFGTKPATIKNEKKTTITKHEPRPVRIITADLHYKVKGVKSTYDRVSLLVSKSPSGDYVAFISSRPDDAGPKIKKALQDTINTIHLV